MTTKLSPTKIAWRAAQDIADGAYVNLSIGFSEMVQRCSLPLTGVGCVMRVYSSLAVIDIERGRFVLREKLPSLSVEDLQSMTGADLLVSAPVADLIVPEL